MRDAWKCQENALNAQTYAPGFVSRRKRFVRVKFVWNLHQKLERQNFPAKIREKQLVKWLDFTNFNLYY
jgi:hypothetical protein